MDSTLTSSFLIDSESVKCVESVAYLFFLDIVLSTGNHFVGLELVIEGMEEGV
jgi:hypothetical protein